MLPAIIHFCRLYAARAAPADAAASAYAATTQRCRFSRCCLFSPSFRFSLRFFRRYSLDTRPYHAPAADAHGDIADTVIADSGADAAAASLPRDLFFARQPSPRYLLLLLYAPAHHTTFYVSE